VGENRSQKKKKVTQIRYQIELVTKKMMMQKRASLDDSGEKKTELNMHVMIFVTSAPLL